MTNLIALQSLPYAENALEPTISARTVGFHYGKHHAGYVSELNKIISGTPYEAMQLGEIIRNTVGKPEHQRTFDNAAQVWNHTFYWHSLSPAGGGMPAGPIALEVDKSFGSYENLRVQLGNAAATLFGSGWAWLVKDNSGLKVMATKNAETPLTQNVIPLLAIDVWEHAYYLDYQNGRRAYIDAVIDKLLNWSFANRNLEIFEKSGFNAA